MKKKLKYFLVFTLITLPILFSSVVAIVYWKQQDIAQEILTKLNEDFKGRIELSGSHIEPFAQFPHISIDLENFRLYSDKKEDSTPIIKIKDLLIGFNLYEIINGQYNINSIKLNDGFIHAIQDSTGSMNLLDAVATTKPAAETKNDFHIDLKKIELYHIDVYKLNEANGVLVDLYINKIKSKIKKGNNLLYVDLDADCNFTLIKNNDTTFLHDKHLQLSTELDFDQNASSLKLYPSTLGLDMAQLNVEGLFEFKDTPKIDIKVGGNKPDFSLFVAMAPPKLKDVLAKYDNKGKVYFDAVIKGEIGEGKQPFIEAKFGCEKGYFKNTEVNKKLDELHFDAYFTNGEARNLSTMKFMLNDFSAVPEAGKFKGKLKVENFESPEIDLNINADFELNFLTRFFDIKTLSDLKGKVVLDMNFRDIIDLENPEKSLEKLNESYYTKLKISNLSFSSSAYHLPIKQLDVDAIVEGKALSLNQFYLKIGKSDLQISGQLSDLPAVIHHQPNEVISKLKIKSKYLDIKELTSGDTIKKKPFNEKIENFNIDLAFKCKANAFTESKYLPIGEFFIDDLNAKFKNYPHTLHKFRADVYITETDFRVIDFSGILDESDFHFSGNLKHYDLWMIDSPEGDTKIEYQLTANMLKLQNLFSYNGQNYVPEDYQHEEFRQVKIFGHTDIHFKKGKLHSTDIYFDQLSGKMKMHPLKLDQFKGRIHLENEHLLVENFNGRIGNTDFNINIDYFLGKDQSLKKRNNYFYLDAANLDMDELFNYEKKQADKKPDSHDTAFNIYTIPFTDMRFKANIGRLKYHRYDIKNFHAKLRTTPQHYLYVDSMSLDAADGSMFLKGYFNGSDSKKIYFSPDLKMKGIDLDKMMFKFENFGQDKLVSDNLHGKVNARITGKMHMYPDLTPKIDDSDLHIEVDVTNGMLENFALLDAMSGYFADKNLKKVRFDTLSNALDFNKGVLSIPNMTINSSLGFMQISGKQDLNMNMEYFVRVPARMVTSIAAQKLFGRKKDTPDANQIDEIKEIEDINKVRFVNINIKGNPSNLSFSLGKDPKLKRK